MKPWDVERNIRRRVKWNRGGDPWMRGGDFQQFCLQEGGAGEIVKLTRGGMAFVKCDSGICCSVPPRWIELVLEEGTPNLPGISDFLATIPDADPKDFPTWEEFRERAGLSGDPPHPPGC